MRVQLPAFIILFAFVGSALGLDQSLSARERAVLMREIRDQMNASQTISTELYERYFDAFPASFAELREVLVSGAYRGILLRSGEEWSYGNAYIVPMCQSYERIDHRRYMKKLLRIGIEANNWGELGKDNEKDVYPGDIYFQLIARYPCGPQTQKAVQEQMSVIVDLVPEFSDPEIEAIYNSLSWEASPTRSPLDWFLQSVCSRYPNRCELTKMLHEKYVNHASDDSQPH